MTINWPGLVVIIYAAFSLGYVAGRIVAYELNARGKTI